MLDIEMVTLADGREVPRAAVDALDTYDATVWPGSTFPTARAAVVWTVMESLRELGYIV